MNQKLIRTIVLTFPVLLFYSCGKKTEETKPIRKDVTETVFASGILEADNTYDLTAQADGYLSQVNFEEGDVVAPGNVLAIVNNREAAFNEQSATDLYKIAHRNTQNNAPALQQAQNTININKQKMELDLTNLQRYQKLWENNSIAKIDLDNAKIQYESSKSNYENALENYKQSQQQANQQAISTQATKNIYELITGKNKISAVVAGKILKKYKQPGDYVKRGESIALIGNIHDIYSKVNVDEGNIGKIKVGQIAYIQLNINKEKIYKGTVKEIYPSFDESTQSFICKLAFTDSLDFTIVNTQLQSNIIVTTTKNALLIPRKYLDFGGYVQVKGQKEKVKVVTKFVSNEWVQVLSGIDENTVLVTENLAANKTNTSEAGAQLN
ncbi:efflux RND transporter periplasmic adaptor subunit [Mucilaginibacter sp. OK283]|uniref:efflux RND transporter periplasmic adaptor subunit n=1 Tax=Mucilaginibacter sp. OK283 TaxID=1881049 RepID=UPI0008CC2E74|nr:HlyD family efflux transporter periplasmic adaptor subunit [Mucilaginibacter sp. OK283]SEP40427.1 Barrel-sandwich domain of CusB or HlyD membrane-fusion [Mucilaginibacter sp. OK283]